MSSPPRRSARMDSSPTRDDITEILPHLFLGSQAGARNLEMLRQCGITHILTMMSDPPPPMPKTRENGHDMDGFCRMYIKVQDWPDENEGEGNAQELFTHFRATNAFIDSARSAQESVLVHCLQGVSRSATVVAAYLMATHAPWHGADTSAVIAFLRERRPVVQPNAGFVDQLALYGRCDCDLEAHPTAVEAWRAGRTRRTRRWEQVDSLRQEGRESVWLSARTRARRWIAAVFA
ncbi:protein-tyrosine phosphatase-like protein [Mycena filopes]|nr:protein-tyrosine phosphatase-like protein [Mycena filopes]